MEGCTRRPGKGYVVCYSCFTALDPEQRRELRRLEIAYRDAPPAKVDEARGALWAYRDELGHELFLERRKQQLRAAWLRVVRRYEESDDDA